MKKLIVTILLMLPILGMAQAHLGETEYAIKNYHPEATFKTGYDNDGQKYIYTDMALGNFTYYIDSDNLSHYNIQIPYDMKCVNAQVEIYNKKYVIVSGSKWKAYLEGGFIMYINLYYNTESKLYYFAYSEQ